MFGLLHVAAPADAIDWCAHSLLLHALQCLWVTSETHCETLCLAQGLRKLRSSKTLMLCADDVTSRHARFVCGSSTSTGSCGFSSARLMSVVARGFRRTSRVTWSLEYLQQKEQVNF